MSDETLQETLNEATENQEQPQQDPQTPQDPQEQQQEQQQEQPEEQPQQQQQEDSRERNFRELREKAERAERERADYERRVREYEQYMQQMQQQQQQQPKEEEPEFTIGDDDLAEGKHLKAWQKQQKRELEKMKEQYQKQQQALEQQTTEMRIKSAHPDYEKVVNQDTIKKLKELEPDIAKTISYGKDLYSQAVTAYRLIKQFGIYKEDTYKQDRDTAQQNLSKPKPAAAAQKTDSQMSYANEFDKQRLSQDRRRQLYEEMRQYAGN